MPIRYRCPACGQLLGVSSKAAGRTFDCPTCGVPSVVPAADEALEPAPASPAEAATTTPGLSQPRLSQPPPDVPAAGEYAALASPPAETTPIRAGVEPAVDEGEFVIRRRSPDEEEMDLTPMVDMTFLLLIFFMITASFSIQKSIDFPPPDRDRTGAALTTHTLEEFEDNSVLVRVDDRNVIYVDDERLSDARRLVDVLRSAMSARRNELVLTADSAALHETVVAVIDAANASGMQKIRLAVQKDE